MRECLGFVRRHDDMEKNKLNRLGNSMISFRSMCVAVCATASLSSPAQSAPDQAGAPAATAKAAHPDLTGVWMQADASMEISTRPEERLGLDMKPLKELPYTAWGRAQAEHQRIYPETDPTTSCFPLGTPRSYRGPYPFQFIQRPEVTAILFELSNKYRVIYTDGRGHPGDLDSTFMGHSIGHWEGDTFVVDTVGLTDRSWLQDLLPKSDQLHLTERITKIEDGKLLRVQLTIDDPKTYTQPWYWVMYYRSVPWELKEYICEENNRTDRSHYEVLREEEKSKPQAPAKP